MVQKTDYPWSGKISITVNPKEAKKFSVRVRIPDRKTSKLYTSVPEISGVKSFSVNGEPVKPVMEKGYAVVTRQWKAGDRIELELPMEPQRITADDKILADKGRVALRYGPMIYNVEGADQADINQSLGTTPLKAVWRPDLLGGVMALTGTWADGKPLLAIPNYARLNRIGQLPGDTMGADPSVNYAPGSTPAPAPSVAPGRRNRRGGEPKSEVWINAK
jgi:hypothetical protein